MVVVKELRLGSDHLQGFDTMSHRDRKDYRRRDPGLDTGHSSSRRGLGSGRERERPRRSRSRSPRERQKSKEHDSDPRRKEDRRVHGPERKGDDKRDRRRDSRGICRALVL